MGCAHEMWNDKRWNAILQALLPDVHSDVTKALHSGKSMAAIIPMFENNPITAAYGALQTTGTAASIFEWDAFFDPVLVKKWVARPTQGMVSDILNTMLIAHGGTKETIKENKLGNHQYRNIMRLPKSKMGGLLALHWMDIFARALELGSIAENQLNDAIAKVQRAERVNSTDQATKHAFVNPKSFYEAVTIFKSQVKAESFAVVLDLKHYSKAGDGNFMPKLLDSLIKEMNDNGIRVEAVGNFDFHKFPKNNNPQRVLGTHKEFPAATKIKFFHHAGGLQKELGRKVGKGDTVFFNAAYLVNYIAKSVNSDKLQESMLLDFYQMGSLAVYQRLYNLNLGLYVQENDLCPGAYDAIAKAVNNHPEIFNFGFAWGGVMGKVPVDIKPLKKKKKRRSKGKWKIPLGAGVQSSKFLGRKKLDPNESRNTLFDAWARSSQDKQRISDAIAEHVGASTAAQVIKNVSVSLGTKTGWACIRAWPVRSIGLKPSVEFDLWMGKKGLSKRKHSRTNCATRPRKKVVSEILALSKIDQLTG